MLQEKNQNVIQRASERQVVAARDRGVVGARRHVSNEGQITLQRIADALHPALLNKAHLKSVRRLGVTVIGFSRFSPEHQEQGPPTQEITDQIRSTHSPIDVELGHIGVFGSETKSKLGIFLVSKTLKVEEDSIEALFERNGFPLLKGPYREDGYAPHLSIAQLNKDQLEYFQDPVEIEKLETLAGLGPDSTQSITLVKVKADSMESYKLVA